MHMAELYFDLFLLDAQLGGSNTVDLPTPVPYTYLGCCTTISLRARLGFCRLAVYIAAINPRSDLHICCALILVD